MWCLDLEKLKLFKNKFQNKGMEAIVFTDANSGFHGINYSKDLNFGWQLVNTKPKNPNTKVKLELGPKLIAHHSTIVSGNKMYLIGGNNTKNENKGFYKLDMLNLSWELLEQLQNSKLVPSKYKD